MGDERIVRSVERDFRRCGILFHSNCKRQEKIEKAGRIMITFVGAGPGAEDRSQYADKDFERSRHRDLCGFSCEPRIT